jgi:hypothetical protein
MKLFGFTITRSADKEEEKLVSFATPQYDDGAVNIAAGGTFGTYIDLDGTVRTEAELVGKYRQMMQQPEIEKAVNEVVNEAIVDEEDQDIVEILMEDMQVAGGERLKKLITEEFKVILQLLNFDKNAYDIFRRWYVDGRCYYHVIIDNDAPQEGIKELRYIDPRQIRKIREVLKTKDPETQIATQKTANEYYLFNEKGLSQTTRGGVGNSGSFVQQGIKIAKGSIIHAPSGIMDQNNTMVLSYMHNAIKPLNQLRALEDASIIYHLSRAPERRVFYIDVGSLPKMKAEQHVQNMMTKHKNRVSYNTTTGETSDNRKFMHMLEDYWFPRRGDSGRGTEISVLQGGTQLPDLLQSVEYFQDRLYRSLQVPLTRMKPDAIYNIGRATEITRDEVNYSKFIDRVRMKFAQFLQQALYKQLVLKNIVTPRDWDNDISKDIKFRFARDNYFSELKDLEIMNDRLIRMRDADDFAGKYYSHDWIRRSILRQSDEEVEEQDKIIGSEQQDIRFAMPDPEEEAAPTPQSQPSSGGPNVRTK